MNINDIINSIYKLPSTSLDTLTHLISEIEYPKHFHLFRENRKESKSYFLKKGIVRAYAHKDDKEVTFWLGQEGDFIFPLQTLFVGLGEYANVELLENCILYEIDLERLQNLYLNDIHIANWGRKYAEYACIKSEKLFISRQFKTSLERYQELINEYPDITQRVQLGTIASYLGISQVNLSRIRAQIR
jgi:hypothetical protein bfra3_11261